MESVRRHILYRRSSIKDRVADSLTLHKARSGIYSDTPENRKLNRVGQRYGNTPKEEPVAEKKVKVEQEEPQKKEKKTELPKEDIAKLTQMKSLISTDSQEAYSIFKKLSPEAQSKVPKKIIEQLSKDSVNKITGKFKSFDSMMNMETGMGTEFNSTLAEQWFKGMEDDYSYLKRKELNALRAYSGVFFLDINNTLREIDGYTPILDEEKVDEYIDTISKAIKDSPGLTHDTTSYRGISLEDEELAEFFDALDVGSVYSDSAFQSTTIDRSIAEGTFKKSSRTDRGVVLRILIPKGTKAMPLPSTKAEDIYIRESEVLLDRDTHFEVVERDGDNITVIVRENGKERSKRQWKRSKT